MDIRILGKRINTIRTRRGLTSEKLAEKCCISAAYLRQIESGRKTPSLPLFILLCNRFEVPPGYLLQDTVSSCGQMSNAQILQLIRAFVESCEQEKGPIELPPKIKAQQD